MANATSELQVIEAVGGPGMQFHLPVKASQKIFKGTLVSQIIASGFAVNYSTALSSVCVGVCQADVDNSTGADGDLRVLVESHREYLMPNGTAGDAFSEATLIGVPVFASDDNTAAKTSNTQARKCIGRFYGMSVDGKVRVFIDPGFAQIIDKLQTLTDTPATADALRDNIVATFG